MITATVETLVVHFISSFKEHSWQFSPQKCVQIKPLADIDGPTHFLHHQLHYANVLTACMWLVGEC